MIKSISLLLFLVTIGAASAAIHGAVPTNSSLRNPTAQDDSTRGNVVNELWLNTSTGTFFTASGVSPGAAVWANSGTPSSLPCDAVASVTVCYGLFSLTSSWSNGNLFDIQRSTDSTTTTIAAVGGKADMASLNSFLAGGAGGVITKWYDQSGNGNDCIQATAANALALRNINGVLSLVGDYQDTPIGVTAFMRSCALPSVTFGTSNSAFSVTQVSATHYANFIWELGTSTAGYMGLYGNALNTWRVNNNATSFTNSETEQQVWSVVASPSTGTFGVGENIATAANQALNAAPTGGSIGLSFQHSSTSEIFDGQMYAFAAWNGLAMSGAQSLAVRKAFYQAYKIAPQMRNDQIVFAGDSWLSANGGQFQSPNGPFGLSAEAQVTPLLNRPVTQINLALSGEKLATMLSEYSSLVAPLFDSSRRNNILIFDGGANDIFTAGHTTAQTFADLQSYCNAAIATGWQAYYITSIAFPGGNTWDTSLNSLVRGGPLSCTALIDIGANPHFDPSISPAVNTNQTYYSTDDEHPNAFGYSIWAMAPYISTAINGVLGVGP
jgi:hypothetical protein